MKMAITKKENMEMIRKAAQKIWHRELCDGEVITLCAFDYEYTGLVEEWMRLHESDELNNLTEL